MYEDSESDAYEYHPDHSTVRGSQAFDNAPDGDATSDKLENSTNRMAPIVVLDSDDEIKQKGNSTSKPQSHRKLKYAGDVDDQNVFDFDYREDSQDFGLKERSSEMVPDGDSLADDDEFVASPSPYSIDPRRIAKINCSSRGRETQHNHGGRRTGRLSKRKRRDSDEEQDSVDDDTG